MRFLGTTARRVGYAILVTALIPLLAALLISRAIIARVTATAFQPEFAAHLERAVDVYADLAKALKHEMRTEGQVVAASEALRAAVRSKDAAAIDRALAAAMAAHPSLASLAVETCSGTPLGRQMRRWDPLLERVLEVRRALGPPELGDATDCAGDEPAIVVALFTTRAARFEELERLQEFKRPYDEMVRDNGRFVNGAYSNAAAVLLAITLILAAGAGVLVARPVTRRIAALAAATRPVAEGDLTVRVDIPGNDEVADLGRAFNRMLEELDRSRARIEFLKRIGEWQKMARRLAHEIKNPLTPIQLAVEECHRRYPGDDPGYRRILDITLEVVEEEVGSLRRLVGEFSNFARLPRAELVDGDLAAFLREQGARFAARDAGEDTTIGESALLAAIDLEVDVPDEPMMAAIDREMLHRVLANAIKNAAQALRGVPRPSGRRGRVRLRARAEETQLVVCIDDDGPGIAPEIRGVLFDPYVTTKRDGTGLGLSIVKKIIVDHGGTIDAGTSELGGAEIRITLPRAGTPGAHAAKERSEGRAEAPPSSQGASGSS